jgi:hypothetical protein
MNESTFADVVDELSTGREPSVVLRATVLASQIVAESDGAASTGDPAAALAPVDDVLDAFLMSTGALVVLGGREPGLRGVAIALQLLAVGSIGKHGERNPVVEALLSRAVLVLAAFALAWQRSEALPVLAHVTRGESYGPPESVLASTGLRHLDLYERGADKAFQAHLAWLMARAWRTSVPPLATDESVQVALAEADIISGCLITAGGRSSLGGNLYSAGVAQSDRSAQDRLVARVRDQGQRAAFRELFAVGDDALEQTIEDAYSRLTAGEHSFPSRQGLFTEL